MVFFVNEGLIRKESGKVMPNQHGLDILAKEFGIFPKGTSLKDLNQASDMSWHIFEKIISDSVRKMNCLGVKEKLGSENNSNPNEITADGRRRLRLRMIKGGVIGRGIWLICRLREMEKSRWI